MRKIPTIFDRDWQGDRSRVLNEPIPDCSWVFAGDGIATRKYDGSCAAIIEGLLYRRHEVREGKSTPEAWIPVEHDRTTAKVIGWVPVGGGPEDRWFREALTNTEQLRGTPLVDGTYELVGPKVQGNPEGYPDHLLIAHSAADELTDAPRTYQGLRLYLEQHDIEGIVWHHPDGRMAKIKARDFGIRRGQLQEATRSAAHD